MDVHIYRQKFELNPLSVGIAVPDEAKRNYKDFYNQTLTYTPDMPQRGSAEAAGYDVYAFLPETRSMSIAPLQTVKVPTGLFMAEEPGSVILACSRSGLASAGVMIANGPGIIDSDYRGEIKILLTYIAPPDFVPFVINHGMRIAQFLFLAPGRVSEDVNFIDSPFKDLRDTKRGQNGFGSTGQ